MTIGVVNKRTAAQTAVKVIGSIVNFTLSGGEIKVKAFLDTNKHKLTIFTSGRPEGETFSDLPKGGIFFPAIQARNLKFNSSAKLLISSSFDLKVPQDKASISL